MKILHDIRFYIVITCLTFIWSTKQLLDVNDKIVALEMDLEKVEAEKDSLRGELFVKEVELGRYEVAYEIFMERNPKAAKEYGTIISEETE